MRLFVAVFPPPAVQHAAAGVIEALRTPGDGVSWVKPDNMHYTMRFIGEAGEDGARRIADAARAAAAGHRAFDAALGAPGAFPRPRGARVLWLGLSRGARELEALAESLATELDRRGWPREPRGFSAHLTIGRVREPHADWTSRLEAAAPIDAADAAFRVDRLCVVESKLNPKGSVYTVREAAELLAG